jgi:hypothetical protein
MGVPTRAAVAFAVLAGLAGPTAPAQEPAPATATAPQTEADEYTRYELLAPGTARFRILYEVTATTPGATDYSNSIRKGSEASGIAVTDRASGRPLEWSVVSGTEGRSIRVRLPRPVPQGGGIRLLIEKTYEDPKSYRQEGDRLVFERSLGIRRNAVVLPPGYELVACNTPSQVIQQADGRIAVSFMNPGPAAVPLVLAARRLGP